MGFNTKQEEQAFLMGAILHGMPIPISDSAPPPPPTNIAHTEEISGDTLWFFQCLDEKRGQSITDLQQWQKFWEVVNIDPVTGDKTFGWVWRWIKIEINKLEVLEVQDLLELENVLRRRIDG